MTTPLLEWAMVCNLVVNKCDGCWIDTHRGIAIWNPGLEGCEARESLNINRGDCGRSGKAEVD